MTWIRTVPISQLDQRPAVFRHPPRQIGVFKVDGRVFAIDNRCPHEGYPLAEGTVDGNCVLTCNWHNWKFRLEDGECLIGGDHVRSYPARTEHGYVWVDMSDPPVEDIRRDVLRGLRAGFDDNDFGRICREIARLHYQEIDPRDAVREALRWTHDRLEFGAKHSMAGAADWLALAEEFSTEFELRLVCLSEAVGHLALDSLRHREYPYPRSDARFDATEFAAAIEAQQAGEAEAMVAGGLASGLHWPQMERAFAAAALAHYNDFGHSIIYVSKASQLLDALGAEVEASVVLPLARHLVYTSREDLIPEFRDYPPALERLAEPGDSNNGSELIANVSELVAPFPVSVRGALGWVGRNMASHEPLQIYDALLGALARNMLHFDTDYGVAYDRSVSANVSWLGFTHGITFSNAVRVTCGKYPELWPQGLLQMACFLGRNSSFVDRDVREEDWRISDAGAFFDDAIEELMDHGIRDPIFSVHRLKTSLAIRAELPFASAPTGNVLLAALNRFLNSPLKGKHSRRLARQAISLVARDFEDPAQSG